MWDKMIRRRNAWRGEWDCWKLTSSKPKGFVVTDSKSLLKWFHTPKSYQIRTKHQKIWYKFDVPNILSVTMHRHKEALLFYPTWINTILYQTNQNQTTKTLWVSIAAFEITIKNMNSVFLQTLTIHQGKLCRKPETLHELLHFYIITNSQ